MTADNKPNVSADSIDLLDKLLRYNHLDRLTASEALAHCFFSTYILLAPPTATPYYAYGRPISYSVYYSPNTIDMLMNHLYLSRRARRGYVQQMPYASRHPLTPLSA